MIVACPLKYTGMSHFGFRSCWLPSVRSQRFLKDLMKKESTHGINTTYNKNIVFQNLQQCYEYIPVLSLNLQITQICSIRYRNQLSTFLSINVKSDNNTLTIDSEESSIGSLCTEGIIGPTRVVTLVTSIYCIDNKINHWSLVSSRLTNGHSVVFLNFNTVSQPCYIWCRFAFNITSQVDRLSFDLCRWLWTLKYFNIICIEKCRIKTLELLCFSVIAPNQI